MLKPLLSDYDPITSSEGALDPLGLYSIADSLGRELVPGVRERQSHPRFLTAIAVGAYLCSAFDDDTIAADGVSEPWQVYEWHVVEGIVRSASKQDEYRGLPGSLKAEQAISENQHLSAVRYLKTPRVFGFHGVYRLLAHTLEIIDQHGRLDVNGWELLNIWENEQKLHGFVGTSGQSGSSWRKTITEAIEEALRVSRLNRSGGWSGWQFFFDHLRHTKHEEQEAAFIRTALMDSSSGYRSDVLDFLVSETGQRLWTSTSSEFVFHKALSKNGAREMRPLLDAIMAYEQFARHMTDAFYSCLHTMTRKAGKTPAAELAAAGPVRNAYKNIPASFHKLSDLLQPYGLSLDFENGFKGLDTRGNIETWVCSLLEHHFRIQRSKPPNGKNPWIERFSDSSYMVRTAYRQTDPPAHKEELQYVHAYRTNSLWSFASDLRMN